MPYIYQDQKIITISKSSRDNLEQIGFSRPENIDVINPGVDTYKYHSQTKTPYPSFLYLGRHKSYKNIDIAIKSFAKIIKEHPTARMTVAGEGETAEDLKALVERLRLASHVSFKGRVSEQEKVSLYAQSWVALQPSSYEGWGLTVIEANACGTPVIASGVKGLQDSVKHGETGLLAAVKDVDSFVKAMNWITSYPTSRLELSRQAQEWAGNFKWEVQAQEFISIMQRELVRTHHVTQPVARIVYQKKTSPIFNILKILILPISKILSN
jgi:glycosyltransferase involved in cell wall biosynthesis